MVTKTLCCKTTTVTSPKEPRLISLRKGNILATPPLDAGILGSYAQARDSNRRGLGFGERKRFPPAPLVEADEAFLTSTIKYSHHPRGWTPDRRGKPGSGRRLRQSFTNSHFNLLANFRLSDENPPLGCWRKHRWRRPKAGAYQQIWEQSSEFGNRRGPRYRSTSRPKRIFPSC